MRNQESWSRIQKIDQSRTESVQNQVNFRKPGVLAQDCPGIKNPIQDKLILVDGFLGANIDITDRRHTRVYSLVNLEVVIQVVLLNCKNNNTSLLTLLSSVKFESDDLQ